MRDVLLALLVITGILAIPLILWLTVRFDRFMKAQESGIRERREASKSSESK
jgi:hypothetical protein